MKPIQLILRGFAEKKEGQWSAVCIDFSLAAQANSLDEATDKLNEMIKEYIDDALVGEDHKYAKQLILQRKSPLGIQLKYYYIMLRCKIDSLFSSNDEERNDRALNPQIPMPLRTT